MSKREKLDKEVRNQIVNYLIKNPIERNTPGCYAEVAAKFKISAEKIRRIYRSLRETGMVDDDITAKGGKGSRERTFKENVKTGEGDLTFVTNKRIKTLKQLIAVCEVDTEEWDIVSYEVNKWEVGRREKTVNWKSKKGVASGRIHDTGRIFVEPLFQVKAKLSRRKVEKDIVKQKEILLNEIKRYSPKVSAYPKVKARKGATMLEICIFDPHFGKLAWREETDEDYDLKIAEKRVKDSVRELLGRFNLDEVEKIMLPIGNDLINIDNRNNTTSNGTPQDSDCRYMKIIRAVKRILIEMIDELSAIAPVDVVIVPGNHDTTSTFMMGEILEAFYHSNNRVNIDNRPKKRKYYEYGLNAIQLTHGDEEKHSELLGIFATEEPVLWGRTKFRFAQLGHFHKNKKMNYVSVDEHHGFQIQILPSLSGTDFWHKSKGYNSLKQAKAMLFSAEEGIIGEATTTVK